VAAFMVMKNRERPRVKVTFQSKEHSARPGAVTTGERAAISKYNELIENYQRHDHLPVLTGQRDGIIGAISQLNTCQNFLSV
jgi:hypothetical protein